MVSTKDEAELVAECLAAGPDSCRRLGEAFGPLAKAVAVNVLGNREDAEDVCQETFIQVFRNLDRYDRSRSFKTWLLTIVYRRALDMIRKRRRFREFAARARYEPAAAAAGPISDPAEPPSLPSHYLDVLSPKERTALCLWANEGYAAASIAEVLGCSPSTARVVLFNARRKIKAVLEKSHGLVQTG